MSANRPVEPVHVISPGYSGHAFISFRQINGRGTPAGD
jgi:hypothetical protein